MKRFAVIVLLGACGKLAIDPPAPSTIDCFGTACSATCCLVDDAALCTEDANACVETIPIGDAGDASITVTSTFECFAPSDCPPNPKPRLCCYGAGFHSVKTGCEPVELLGCGLGGGQVCTTDADCNSSESCHRVDGLPLSVCY